MDDRVSLGSIRRVDKRTYNIDVFQEFLLTSYHFVEVAAVLHEAYRMAERDLANYVERP